MIIVNTKTFKDFEFVVFWAVNNGSTWINNRGTTIEECYWEVYESDTCVVIDCKRISYCSIGYAVDCLQGNILDMLQFYDHLRIYSIHMFKSKYCLI